MSANLRSVTITITEPEAWRDAWKQHMKKTGRKNLSSFIGESVNALIERECMESGKTSPVRGARGLKGKPIGTKKRIAKSK